MIAYFKKKIQTGKFLNVLRGNLDIIVLAEETLPIYRQLGGNSMKNNVASGTRRDQFAKNNATFSLKKI